MPSKYAIAASGEPSFAIASRTTTTAHEFTFVHREDGMRQDAHATSPDTSFEEVPGNTVRQHVFEGVLSVQRSATQEVLSAITHKQ